MPMARKEPLAPQMRCAIYTRKSTSNRLDIEVNTLQTQREVCQAYIKCQAHRNWIEVDHPYDDGGFSGGDLERPALKRLLDDIEAGRVDMLVVYKIDRLSRSLADFVRLLDVLEKYGVGFVSVTQTFDTSDSMGRLVLNILLTFAQFERELASDRTRDKKAALLKRGLFTGGTPPFGYTLAKGGRLIVDRQHGPIVQEIYARYPNETASELMRDLKARGCRTPSFVTRAGRVRGGWPIYLSRINAIITNPIYTGFIEHRGDWIPAQVEPLISRQQWDLVQEVRRARFPNPRDPSRNILLGILHDEQGRRMRCQSGQGQARGRYYKSEHTSWTHNGVTRRVMVGADRVEELTLSSLKAFLIDRVQLKEAIMSLGRYSEEIARHLKTGGRAAHRIDMMPRDQLRPLLLALVPRAEVTGSHLKLHVCCFELQNFLAWDGIGVFQKSAIKPRTAADRIYTISAAASLICGHKRLALPIAPFHSLDASPKPWLVDVLRKADKLRRLTLANRTKTVSELARESKLGPTQFAQFLRVNYLAPDIQAAIVDGTQPDTMTTWDLLSGPMPLDWEQQRQLFGFR